MVRDEGVAAILLAAGRSERMGRPKQLLMLGGKPAVAVCVEMLLGGGVADIVVVVNEEGEPIVRALGEYPVRFACNDARPSEMIDSIRAGIRMLGSHATVAVHPCDCPLVAPATVQALVAAAKASHEAIVVPRMKGKRGHPVIVPRPILEELAWRPTLRHLIDAHPALVSPVDVEDAGILIDMDTPQDYRRMQGARRALRFPKPDRLPAPVMDDA